jgi:hypothetical protein
LEHATLTFIPTFRRSRPNRDNALKGTAYRPLVIESMESYYVDTALDNDADMDV